jgi:hypothetical protein
MEARRLISVILALLALPPITSCSQSEKEKGEATEPVIISLEQAGSAEIIPLSDGGAYIQTISTGLWYVKGNEAIRVMFPAPPGAPDQKGTRDNFLLMEVTPTIDGGAYATSLLGGGIWYLRKGEATRVHEVPAISAAIEGSDRIYSPEEWFVMYTHELKRRQSVEAGIPESFDSGYDDRDR